VLLALSTAALAAGGYYLYRRFLTGNFAVVVPGQVYRSAQPSPEQLEHWARQYGLKAVINLRGRSSQDFHAAEQRAAETAGIRLIDVRLSAVRLPTVPNLRRLIRALEDRDLRPMLLHCRDGADRTGVASVMAAMAVGGEDYASSRQQLSLRFLHVDNDPEHIGGLLTLYEAWCRRKGIGTGGWKEFRKWALDVYRPYYYHVDIQAPLRLVARPGQLLSVPVMLVNRAERTIPAGDPNKVFNLAVFSGSSEHDRPDREFGRRTPLPKQDIAPAGSVRVVQQVRAPRRPGEYTIHFDVVEEQRTWFARQGSPVPTCRLIVRGEDAPASGPAARRP
jgi:protein tyrosine phosphatase (PTP) superfamily phosphohydrolase (DUF442 family)